MRRVKFIEKEYYHIYNRGVDKRSIFEDKGDVLRFLQSIKEFNREDSIGSLFEYFHSSKKQKFGGSTTKEKRLVNIIAYCLNQNHFHFILEPVNEEGVQKFMHKLSTGYTGYFNEKYKRTGSLFEGRYKAKHISSNEYLLHLGVYVNLNDRVHQGLNKDWMKSCSFSSFREYMDNKIKGICKKDIIIGQFKDTKDFHDFCISVLSQIKKKKEDLKNIESIYIE